MKIKEHVCRRCGIGVWESRSLCGDCLVVVGREEAAEVWLWDRSHSSRWTGVTA